MRAVFYEANGPARDVLRVEEVEMPNPGTGEVRVRLRTSGVNPSDVKSRGLRKLLFPRVIPHSDGAGEIEAVGAGVPKSRIGERVWIWNGQWQRPFGTAAEFIVLPAAQAVQLPDNVSFEEGACLGIPAMTAHHAVELTGADSATTLLVSGVWIGEPVRHPVCQGARCHCHHHDIVAGQGNCCTRSWRRPLY